MHDERQLKPDSAGKPFDIRVQVLVVDHLEDALGFPLHILQICHHAGPLIDRPPKADFDAVVVAVSMQRVAFAVDGDIFGVCEMGRVKAMGGREVLDAA